jgi:shikimate kinase
LRKNNNVTTLIKPIFLMGFMGSGKTTLGRALHKVSEVDFIDLDDVIEERAGKTIKEIFAEQGEAVFRQLESEALADAAKRGGIVACGGGTPCFGNNMELMNSVGVTVWLQAPIDLLVERLIIAADRRPLIAGLTHEQLRAFVAKTVEARSEQYSRAQERFDASDLDTIEGIARSVDSFITRFFV